jgi:acyl-CoA reductase-like NAD-dependent aldehyde dehydrogenase
MGSQNCIDGKWQSSLTGVTLSATDPSTVELYALIATGEAQDNNLSGNFIPVTIVDNPPDKQSNCPRRTVRPDPAYTLVRRCRRGYRPSECDELWSGCVGMGTNREEAIAVSKRLEAGTDWVNKIHIHGIDIPFGGKKSLALALRTAMKVWLNSLTPRLTCSSG